MTTENNLRDALLRENGIPHGSLSSDDRMMLDRLLERDKARVRHTKWIALTAWGMLVLCYLVGYASQYFRDMFPRWIEGYVSVLVMVFYTVALIYTIGLVIRVFILRDRESKIHRVQVEARLASIDKALQEKLEKDAKA